MTDKHRTDRFVELLLEATANIPSIYFQLPVAGKENPVYRERVYCYELYHQLRLLLDNSEELRPYALSAEIDKQGHPIIRPCSPDLVFHSPGDMRFNVAAVEVKSANGMVEGIEKDFGTLSYFVGDKAQYQLGIELVYGGTQGDLGSFRTQFEQVALKKLRLYWHPAAGERATRIL